MSTTRAKFRCMEQKSSFGMNGNIFVFSAVYDDGIPEHQRYAQYTPTGRLEIQVDNPNVSYAVGTLYYLDITEATE